MKPAHSAHRIILILCLCLALPGMAASPEFAAFYESLLKELSSRFPGKEPGYYDQFIVVEFNSLLKVASREEIGDAIAVTLADPQKREVWTEAYSLSGLLGSDVDRAKIVAAIRANLAYYFVSAEVKSLSPARLVLIDMAAHELCSYGTDDDVKLVKSFAADVAKINPFVAESLGITISDRAKFLEFRAKEASRKSPK